MMFKADDVLQTQGPARLSRYLYRIVRDRVAPVESNEGCCAIITAEQTRPDQSP